MASVNRAIIVGNLGQDPEIRYMPNGDAACNLSVATTDTWKDKQTGEKKEATEWHRVSFFGKLAKVCGEYLKKGAAIYVEGSIHTRKWTDKEGQDRYTTEIRGERMQMLSGRQSGDGARSAASAPAQPDRAPSGSFEDFADDIPFN